MGQYKQNVSHIITDNFPGTFQETVPMAHLIMMLHDDVTVG